MSKSEQELKEQIDKILNNPHNTHRVGSHSDDYGGTSDRTCYCDLNAKLLTLTLNYGREQKMQGWHEGRTVDNSGEQHIIKYEIDLKEKEQA